MAKIIPNEESYIAYVPTIASSTLNPTLAEITGASSKNLTPYVVGINASSQGNIVNTPSFDTRFETSIVGTVQATFTIDLYRDSTTDTAWTALPRNTAGYIIVSRYPGTHALVDPASGKTVVPGVGDTVEVWPITVVSRTMQNMTSNTTEMFTVTCSVPREPNEAATVS